MASSGSALYSWAHVADWFEAVFGPEAPALPSDFDRVIAAADHLVRARALLENESRSLADWSARERLIELIFVVAPFVAPTVGHRRSFWALQATLLTL